MPTRRAVFRAISVVVVAILVIIAGLAIYVYKASVGKFEVRRLSLPTRVYADYTPLQAGTVLGPDDILEKLSRLGYRETNSIAQSGDFAEKRGELYIYTRQFTHPTGTYASEPIRLTFKGAQIASITSLKDGHAIDKAALEPELLTSILSDQLENRQPVTLNQVPQILQDAVIVTEDVRFWHHPGVDPIGILRAGFRNLRAGGVEEGASTLTQQLVKNYYLTAPGQRPDRSMKRKIPEAFMAVILDAKYSKQEILEAYLNDIYLGRNRSISVVGVGEASHFYFGHPVSEITVPEAALLAGMIRSPNNYSPFTHPAQALERRNTVLGLMLHYKKIDPATYDKAINTPLPRQPFKQKTGLGSIPFYVDRVLDEMGRDYGVKDVKGRGLQIFTAIDLNAQDTAAKTLEAGLESLERNNRALRRRNSPLQGVLISVDVPTGEIRALVGGRNYDYSQFNRALNSKRQIGSLIKPFVYATAFEPSLSQQNITQATLVSDQRIPPMKQYQNWSPRNYEDSYHGTVTVREALEESMNSASVRIGLASGIPNVIRTAHTLGVQTEIPDNPAMLLGAVGIPPIEMADAYSTIARVGSRLPLRTIRFVEDDRGNQVSAGDVVNPVQVFPARDMYVLTNVMKGVIDRGTAASARSLGFKLIAAGKTGTTNDKRDAWFIGFTPQTLALAWVGFDDNSETGLSGGSGAVPIWTRYMEAETAGQPNIDFPVPQGIAMVQVDETSGGLATPNCPHNVVIDEAFKDGTQPAIACPLHSPQPPPLPPTDQFGTPVALDTTGTIVTDTTATSAAPPPPMTATAAPPPPAPMQPPPTETRERSRSSSPPPPSTNTSAPQTSTSSTSTTGSSPPPSTTSTQQR